MQTPCRCEIYHCASSNAPSFWTLFAGRDLMIADASGMSDLRVTFRLVASDSTMATGCPVRSTSMASSVTGCSTSFRLACYSSERPRSRQNTRIA